MHATKKKKKKKRKKKKRKRKKIIKDFGEFRSEIYIYFENSDLPVCNAAAQYRT
jgi:hypothetical protein